MAEVPTFFSGLMGGVVGAVAAVPVPAEGERVPRAAPGTDWGECCHKLHESGRELEGFVQQLTFIVGKAASCVRVGVEYLGRCLSEGRLTEGACLMDKSDVEQSLDAGKQGASYLLRGGRLVLEALLEGAKVAATRALIAVEGGKEVVLRNMPYTQEKLAQAYSSFLRGYQSGGRALGGYQAPPAYHPPPSYGAPPPASQEPSGFFW